MRILFTASLTHSNLPSTQSGAELAAFRGRNWLGRPAAEQAGCCTYDQVYRAIIERLNQTSGGPSADSALSRAYIEELEVSGGTRAADRLGACMSGLIRADRSLKRPLD